MLLLVWVWLWMGLWGARVKLVRCIGSVVGACWQFRKLCCLWHRSAWPATVHLKCFGVGGSARCSVDIPRNVRVTYFQVVELRAMLWLPRKLLNFPAMHNNRGFVSPLFGAMSVIKFLNNQVWCDRAYHRGKGDAGKLADKMLMLHVLCSVVWRTRSVGPIVWEG